MLLTEGTVSELEHGKWLVVMVIPLEVAEDGCTLLSGSES
jgi:hypothetical protein